MNICREIFISEKIDAPKTHREFLIILSIILLNYPSKQSVAVRQQIVSRFNQNCATDLCVHIKLVFHRHDLAAKDHRQKQL